MILLALQMVCVYLNRDQLVMVDSFILQTSLLAILPVHLQLPDHCCHLQVMARPRKEEAEAGNRLHCDLCVFCVDLMASTI